MPIGKWSGKIFWSNEHHYINHFSSSFKRPGSIDVCRAIYLFRLRDTGVIENEVTSIRRSFIVFIRLHRARSQSTFSIDHFMSRREQRRGQPFDIAVSVNEFLACP